MKPPHDTLLEAAAAARDTPEPYLDDGDVRLFHGDCIEVMRALPAESVDAIITDPPYGIGFMGKAWDGKDIHERARKDIERKPSASRAATGRKSSGWDASGQAGTYDISRKGNVAFQEWCEAWARECFRLLKPGGHLASFCSTRTSHRMTAGIEDAGFEIRDTLAWLYGSGFPKSLDVSKAIDKRRDWPALAELRVKIKDARTRLGISQSEAARRVGLIAEGESLGGGGFMWYETGKVPTRDQYVRLRDVLALGSECDSAFEAAEREHLGEYADDQDPGGFGDHRFSVVDRSITAPLSEKGKAWQGWGTALKPAHEPITLARKPLVGTVAKNVLAHGTGALNIDACRIEASSRPARSNAESASGLTGKGGAVTFGEYAVRGSVAVGETDVGRWPANVILDAEAAAILDAQSGNRAAGNMPAKRAGIGYGSSAQGTESGERIPLDSGGASRFFYTAKAAASERTEPGGVPNTHPTVKPVDLMRWLIRLLAPPGALILDPFGGSGTTGVAARAENIKCILIERETDYLPIIASRLRQGSLFAEGDNP